tara:strand:+ start:2357 stop:2722 length:366 start_codon:yes stop_codon:yes gene_type:complete
MEGGPKKQEQGTRSVESVDLSESIERASGLYEELKAFEGTDVVGQAAVDEVERIAGELKVVLKDIPAAECHANGLPYHPSDEKAGAEVVPFPSKPDYPLDYEPQSSGADYSKFGGPYQAAA